MFYTFYSYKGGVGRSMALPNIAVLMSNAKLNVIMIDWDLEAPGIERFFSPEIVKQAMNNRGVIDMLLDYKRHVSQYRPEKGKPFFPVVNIEDYLIDITEDKHLRLLPAGYRRQKLFAGYANRVKTFDWENFYENWEGELFFEWLRDQFMEIADVVLIDSRTGVTEMGGVCTYQLADVVILFCAASDQSIDGTLQMVKSFADEELQELRHGRPLYTVTVPSRVERVVEIASINDFRKKFVDSFTKWLPGEFKKVPDFFVDIEIPYVPLYAFEEIIAVNQRDTKLRSVELEDAYIKLLKIIYDISSKDSKLRKHLTGKSFKSFIKSSISTPFIEFSKPETLSLRYTIAKVLLIGDIGVGKSGSRCELLKVGLMRHLPLMVQNYIIFHYLKKKKIKYLKNRIPKLTLFYGI